MERLRTLEAQIAEANRIKDKATAEIRRLEAEALQHGITLRAAETNKARHEQALNQYGTDFDAARAYAHSLGDLQNFLIKVEGVPSDQAEEKAKEHIARWTPSPTARRAAPSGDEPAVHAHDVDKILNIGYEPAVPAAAAAAFSRK